MVNLNKKQTKVVHGQLLVVKVSKRNGHVSSRWVLGARCQFCEKVFHLIRPTKKYCSQACYEEHKKAGKSVHTKKRTGKISCNPRKQKLIKARGAKCEHCKCSNIACLHAHHIIKRSAEGSNDLSNLILLCANCHSNHHDQEKH